MAVSHRSLLVATVVVIGPLGALALTPSTAVADLPPGCGVSLDVLNSPNALGELVVVSGDTIEVEYSLTLGSSCPFSARDLIQLTDATTGLPIRSRRVTPLFLSTGGERSFRAPRAESFPEVTVEYVLREPGQPDEVVANAPPGANIHVVSSAEIAILEEQVGLLQAQNADLSQSLSDLQDAVAQIEAGLSDGDPATVAVTWNDLSGVPAGFADGVDDAGSGASALDPYVTVVQGELDDLAGPHIIFEGVNVHVRSGAGPLFENNPQTVGVGNLIVGYNDRSIAFIDQQTGEVTFQDHERTGSHNLIVGPYHDYTSFGGFLAGERNRVTAQGASVSGGAGNVAAGWRASVSGGANNTASGHAALVCGGLDNVASTDFSSVCGSALSWNDLTDVPAGFADGIDDDTNTQLNEAEVDAFVANNGYLTNVNWSIIANRPAGLDDGDDDTNTQLSEADVDAFVANNGYAAQSALDAFAADLFDMDPMTAPVTWDDLSNVPVGFADGTDDVGSGTFPTGQACLPRSFLRGFGDEGDLLCVSDPACRELRSDRLVTDADLDMCTYDGQAIDDVFVDGTVSLDEATFFGSRLYFAGFEDTSMVGADFTGALFGDYPLGADGDFGTAVDFVRVDLSGASFTGSTGYSTAGIFLDGEPTNDLNSFRVGRPDFELVNLQGADFSFATVPTIRATDSDMTNANLEGACLVYGDFTGTSFDGADFTDASLACTFFFDPLGAPYDPDLWFDATTVFDNTTCPDATNSDDNGGTCIGHLNPYQLPICNELGIQDFCT